MDELFLVMSGVVLGTLVAGVVFTLAQAALQRRRHPW